MALPSYFDSAWKDALDAYFPQFMALLWPDIHAQIDWLHPPVFLEKELQALLRSRPKGRRHVDKLVSVTLRDGQGALLLIHVEIQAGHDKSFARRMFDYHVRLREKHPQRPVVSLAVLTEHCQPLDTVSYAYDYWGCELSFRFPVSCLENWRPRMGELLALAPQNPFAVVILVQLEANAARDARQRLARKTELMRRLLRLGYTQDNVIKLFRVLDAMLALPEDLDHIFADTLSQIGEETQMTYVPIVERILLKREREQGLQEGRQEGRQEGQHRKAVEVLTALATRKFGAVPDWARARMEQTDEATLSRWALQVLDAQRIEDVFV